MSICSQIDRWGVGGLIVSVVVFPLAILFPFIYLYMEGFSFFYFGLWALWAVSTRIYLGWKLEEANEKDSITQE